MKITVIAMGNKMPSWVNEAIAEYQKRLKDTVTLNLVEIPLIKRSKTSDIQRIMTQEKALIEKVIPQGAFVIVMDSRGKTFSSECLASHIGRLQLHESHLCIIIGGPEGFLPEFVAKAQDKWSLSSLTLTHPLARITLLEALYRSFCILNNHPYHK